MMLIYALVGILMIFVIHFDFLPEINTRLLGGILLLYAIYRGYKLLKTGNVRIESDQAHVTE